MVIRQTCLVIAGSMGYTDTSQTDSDGRQSHSAASKLGSFGTNTCVKSTCTFKCPSGKFSDWGVVLKKKKRPLTRS